MPQSVFNRNIETRVISLSVHFNTVIVERHNCELAAWGGFGAGPT